MKFLGTSGEQFANAVFAGVSEKELFWGTWSYVLVPKIRCEGDTPAVTHLNRLNSCARVLADIADEIELLISHHRVLGQYCCHGIRSPGVPHSI